MSDKSEIEICTKCWVLEADCVCGDEVKRIERYARSPLGAVVQPQQDSGVPLNPDRSGHADILAELRARVTYEMTAAERHIALAKANAMRYDEGAAWARHRLAIKMLAWIDELSECQTNSTAPDTTSGSAGMP